ncbi:MAG TPA: hydroxyacid dehydrogenase [Pyrinomonadaceae bacterium]|jgi:phosphoglycerate dehydrogenase-like enzyme|nr:hydroxyacid dehydrogenase [Pyrinomonadaceae bacterium]
MSEGKAERPRVLVLASDVLFPHFFPEAVRARLEEVTDWTRYESREETPELRALVARSDALVTTWHSPFLRADMFGGGARTRLIAHCGGELKARMEEAVLESLAVANSPDPMAFGVAEMALAMTLMLVRRVPQYAEEMRAGKTLTNEYASVGESVRGRTLGLVGFGRIGRAYARMVAPLGVELLVSDPFCTRESAAEHGARLVGLDELLEASSVVVLAAALTPETRGMMDARRLALVEDGAYLVNVARGGLVEMDALLAELRSKRLTAALDVTDPLEPLPADHELRRLPNVYLTPHVAAGGVEVRAAMGAEAVEEVVRFFRGEPLRNRVTREMLARMT